MLTENFLEESMVAPVSGKVYCACAVTSMLNVAMATLLMEEKVNQL